MKVIPVIDVLKNLAVHAVRGERAKYQPLRSVLCPSANPIEVASTFRSLGFDELYMADLDAIAGREPNLRLYRRVNDLTGLRLMVDAGVNTVEAVEKILGSSVSNVIIGTETLNDVNLVGEVVNHFGRDRVIVSLDLKGGRILSPSEALKSLSPARLVERLAEMGVRRVIVLDLLRVGTEGGINLKVVKEILEETPVEVLTGGGVRSIEDLEELREIGVSADLVATALHKGRIRVEDLKIRGFL